MKIKIKPILLNSSRPSIAYKYTILFSGMCLCKNLSASFYLNNNSNAGDFPNIIGTSVSPFV